jgi:asparagine synthase (glutamine-hydrolysing)
MCGIFTILNNEMTQSTIVHHDDETIGTNVITRQKLSRNVIKSQFYKGKSRGPESSKINEFDEKTFLGFHRLAINGLNKESDQPMLINNVYLLCNGEIYNYKELYHLLPDVQPYTSSDCEIIIHLYCIYGIEQTLQMIDGVFAFILIDNNKAKETGMRKMYVARDPYGVRPLYTTYFKSTQGQYPRYYHDVETPTNFIGFASEMKSLIEFKKNIPGMIIEQFAPGTYSQLDRNLDLENSSWITRVKNIPYSMPGFNSLMTFTPMIDYHIDTFRNIQVYLSNAVMKRAIVTDRPIACLLSGGLDSSLITALVNDIHKNVLKSNIPLETYSIGVEGAADLVYAKKVADYLGTNHTEIVLSEDEFFHAIPEVIEAIESYDTTTVRASIGNYLIGKYISRNSEAKVIFNGDGSDELCGGYLYMHACKDPVEFDKESRRLIRDIYTFDVLRSDKCISSHGLEPRTPFLDRSWVSYYLGIHPNVRCHSNKPNQAEKYLLRMSFSEKYYRTRDGKPLLPDEILWRTKEAFSDGVSSTSRSLFQIIQDKIESNTDIMSKLNDINWETYDDNPPTTYEQKYYRYLFENAYPNCGNVIPYFWMPKYVHCKDSSARTLNIYSEINKSYPVCLNV